MVPVECNVEDTSGNIASKCEALLASKARWRCKDYGGDPLCALTLDTSTWDSFWAERRRTWEKHTNKQLGEDGDEDSGDQVGARDTLIAMEETVKMNEMSTKQAQKEHLELQSEEEYLTRTIAELSAQLAEEENEWNLRKVHIINMMKKRTESFQARKKKGNELTNMKTDGPSDQRSDCQSQQAKSCSLETIERWSTTLPTGTRGRHRWSNLRKNQSHLTQTLQEDLESRSKASNKFPLLPVETGLTSLEPKEAFGTWIFPHGDTDANGRTSTADVTFFAPHDFGPQLAVRASANSMMTQREAFRLVRSVDELFLDNPESATETVFAELRRILPSIPVLDQDPNKMACHIFSPRQNAQTLKRYFAILKEEGVQMPENVHAAVDKITLRVSPLPLSLIPSIDHYIIALTKQPEVNAFATEFAKESGGTPLLCGSKSFLAVVRARNNAEPWDFARAGILYPSFAVLLAALEQLRKNSSIRLRYAKSTFGNPNQHGRHCVQLLITISHWTDCYCPFELQLLHQKLNFGEGDNARSASFGKSGRTARTTLASSRVRKRLLPMPSSRVNLGSNRGSTSTRVVSPWPSSAAFRQISTSSLNCSALPRDSYQRIEQSAGAPQMRANTPTTSTRGDNVTNAIKSPNPSPREEPITSVASLLRRSGLSINSFAKKSFNKPICANKVAVEVRKSVQLKPSKQKLLQYESRTATIASRLPSTLTYTTSKVSCRDEKKSTASGWSENEIETGEPFAFGDVNEVNAEKTTKLELDYGKEDVPSGHARAIRRTHTSESLQYSDFTFGIPENRDRCTHEIFK